MTSDHQCSDLKLKTLPITNQDNKYKHTLHIHTQTSYALHNPKNSVQPRLVMRLLIS